MLEIASPSGSDAGAITDATGTRTFAYRSDLQLDTETLDSNFYGGRVLQSTYETGATVGRPNGFQLTDGTTVETDSAITFDPSTGRVATVAQTPSNTTFTYAYTTGSDLPSTVTSGSFQQTFQYDPTKDRLQYASATWNGSPVARYDYTYDALGRRASVAESGVIFGRYSFGGYSGVVTNYGYDARSELTSSVTSFGTNPSAPGSAVSGRTLGYGFDLTGNRINSTVDGQQTTYFVNAINELQKRTIPGSILVTGLAPSAASVTVNGSSSGLTRQGDYFYLNYGATNSSGPVSQAFTITSTPGGTQDRNAFLSQSRSSTDPDECTYDADGNLTQDDHWTYTWDAENRLTTMTSTSAVPDNEKRRLSFTYDYAGRRVQKTVEVWQSSTGTWTSDPSAGGSITRYIYWGGYLVASYVWDSSTSTYVLNQSYLWGLDLTGSSMGAGGAGGLLAEIQASGSVDLAAYDGSGNLTALVDSSSGAITAAYEYGPFGEPLRASGADATINPFRFSTQYTDDNTGLVYYGLRYYDPHLGRWLGRDPIGEQGGLNLYGFVANGPTDAVDVLGMILEKICTTGYTTWKCYPYSIILNGLLYPHGTCQYEIYAPKCQWVWVNTNNGNGSGSGSGSGTGSGSGSGSGTPGGNTSGTPGGSNSQSNTANPAHWPESRCKNAATLIAKLGAATGSAISQFSNLSVYFNSANHGNEASLLQKFGFAFFGLTRLAIGLFENAQNTALTAISSENGSLPAIASGGRIYTYGSAGLRAVVKDAAAARGVGAVVTGMKTLALPATLYAGSHLGFQRIFDPGAAYAKENLAVGNLLSQGQANTVNLMQTMLQNMEMTYHTHCGQ